MKRALAYLGGLVVVMLAAAGAYRAGRRSEKFQERADEERRIAEAVGTHTRRGRELLSYAEKLEIRAGNEKKRARAAVTKQAKAQPTVEDIVSKWRRSSRS